MPSQIVQEWGQALRQARFDLQARASVAECTCNHQSLISPCTVLDWNLIETSMFLSSVTACVTWHE